MTTKILLPFVQSIYIYIYAGLGTYFCVLRELGVALIDFTNIKKGHKNVLYWQKFFFFCFYNSSFFTSFFPCYFLLVLLCLGMFIERVATCAHTYTYMDKIWWRHFYFTSFSYFYYAGFFYEKFILFHTNTFHLILFIFAFFFLIQCLKLYSLFFFFFTFYCYYFSLILRISHVCVGMVLLSFLEAYNLPTYM